MMGMMMMMMIIMVVIIMMMVIMMIMMMTIPKFFLILPDIVANTSCFDGSISTLNIALGNDSTTRPFT